jgi:ankyrin repeat protein
MTITDVYTAIKESDLETVQTYLESVTDVNNSKLKTIDSLLAYAVEQDEVEIVKLLVSFNANPEVYNNWLLKYAYEKGSRNLITYLTQGETDACI